MNPTQISNRGFLFKFDDTNSNFSQETNVYVVIAKNKVFVADTHCGCDSMGYVKDFIKEKCPLHEIVVINTHYDWDHVFGNYAFKDKTIIAHQKTYQLLNKFWFKMFENNKKYTDGDCSKCLPNLLFKEELGFMQEDVRIFYTPGHTSDSISIYDKKDKVLFVADNLELPLPYLQDPHLDRYVKSLDKYEAINFDTLICSHNGVIDRSVIVMTKDYLLDIIEGVKPNIDNSLIEFHEANLKSIRS
ncbi:MAG: hypothetical protein COB02_09425 [Candidatus Cloacimonadota bacterium]|nr:MAG: hypothetical protein COB02_09425 [Candidatus Cloacimonadota bacterium]